MAERKLNGRKFGVTMGTAASVFALLFFWRDKPNASIVAGAIAALFYLFVLAAPKLLEPVEDRWMRFALFLGMVNTKIISAIMFFVFIMPLGIILRLVGQEDMRRFGKQDRASAWEDYRPRQANEKHYENLF